MGHSYAWHDSSGIYISVSHICGIASEAICHMRYLRYEAFVTFTHPSLLTKETYNLTKETYERICVNDITYPQRMPHICDMRHSFLWHDSYIIGYMRFGLCAIWRDMGLSYLWHASYSQTACHHRLSGIWGIRIYDMTPTSQAIWDLGYLQ